MWKQFSGFWNSSLLSVLLLSCNPGIQIFILHFLTLQGDGIKVIRQHSYLTDNFLIYSYLKYIIFNFTIREGAIVFINVLNSKRQSYQYLQNKNPLSGCRVSKFVTLCPCLSMPPFQPLHFIGAHWLLWRHTIPTTTQNFWMLFMNRIDLKMLVNEQIIVNIYREFKYKCIRR